MAIGSGRAALAALAFAASPFCAGAQASTDSLLDKAARIVASSRTIRAQFEQTLTNPDTKVIRVSNGEFAQQGPSRFAFHFAIPAGDAIVADGSAIWVYLPSSARGQALKLPLVQGAQLDLLTQLLTAPRANYKITDGGTADLGGLAVAIVRLDPRSPSLPFARATLWLDRSSALVRQLEVVEHSGLVRRIRFRDIRTDVDLPTGMLTFTVPPNVKVVDASALFGIKPPPR